jgi:hypothetical protein
MHHRLRNLMPMDEIRLPQPAQPAISAAAFCLCSASVVPGLSAQQWFAQQVIYRMAFEQAQAVARPSLPERDILAVWN